MINSDTTPKILLIVLDGFGIGKNYPFNAIQNARMPFYQEISSKFPQSRLLTCGEAVGLPVGVMGNSEVGHTNMGAGRVVYQELTRINKEIREGAFARNPEFLNLLSSVKGKHGAIHLMGLASDAGVHSNLDHLKELIKIFAPHAPVTLHLFSDGRDTPPTSGIGYVRDLGCFLQQYPHVSVGSLSGRYYAMDRDNRWDRVEKAYLALTGQTSPFEANFSDSDLKRWNQPDTSLENGIGHALQVLENSYSQSTTDEFIIPHFFKLTSRATSVADGDAVFFFNFRSDRARELTRAFTEEKFEGFARKKRLSLSRYLCMTPYDKTFGLPVAYQPQSLDRIFPDLLAEKKLKQFRIAETEKYAHVTFFFNGGREQLYPMEERALIASPKDVPTYDLKPEMSAHEVTATLCARLETAQDTFCLVNYANPDMVGHTGNYAAAVKALETIDDCLKKTVTSAFQSGFDVLITADHGNIEEMCDAHGEPHTQHTLNPVPFHYLSKKFQYTLKEGVLADLAPTMLQIMGLDQPREMTGKSLLQGTR